VAASHDRSFFDRFTLVLGILLGVTIALIVLARMLVDDTTSSAEAQDPAYQRELEQRLAPVARVAVSGADNTALSPPAAAPVAVAADMGGRCRGHGR
jgi:hypothetical protein